MLNDQTQSQQTDQQNEGGKIERQFQDTLSRLIAIVGGDKNLFKGKRISKDNVKNIVTELLKEDKEKLEKEVKDELRALLEAYVKMKREIDEEKKKLAKL